MISKYIKELIPGNSRIIIPDFGAFMIQNTPTGQVISFNDFLKFNDSVLLNKIIVSEKIDSNQGKEAIKAYVKEIEAAFKAGEKFAIEGVGYLSKDMQNNIVFTQDENAKPVKPATKKIEPKKESVKEEPKSVEKKEETPVIKIGEQKNVNAKPQDAEKKDAAKVIVPTTSTTTVSSVANVQSAKKTTSIQNTKMEIKTKNKNLNVILIIAAALVILGVLIWLAIDLKWIDRFKPAQQPKEEVVVIDTMPAVDTVAVEDTVAEEAPEVLPEPKIVTDPNAKHCYIIAGSFQVESNASRFQQQMIEKGYDAQIVTRNNGYHYVSLKMFDTRVEAVAEWRNMVAENPELWILIK